MSQVNQICEKLLADKMSTILSAANDGQAGDGGDGGDRVTNGNSLLRTIALPIETGSSFSLPPTQHVNAASAALKVIYLTQLFANVAALSAANHVLRSNPNKESVPVDLSVQNAGKTFKKVVPATLSADISDSNSPAERREDVHGNWQHHQQQHHHQNNQTHRQQQKSTTAGIACSSNSSPLNIEQSHETSPPPNQKPLSQPPSQLPLQPHLQVHLQPPQQCPPVQRVEASRNLSTGICSSWYGGAGSLRPIRGSASDLSDFLDLAHSTQFQKNYAVLIRDTRRLGFSRPFSGFTSSTACSASSSSPSSSTTSPSSSTSSSLCNFHSSPSSSLFSLCSRSARHRITASSGIAHHSAHHHPYTRSPPAAPPAMSAAAFNVEHFKQRFTRRFTANDACYASCPLLFKDHHHCYHSAPHSHKQHAAVSLPGLHGNRSSTSVASLCPGVVRGRELLRLHCQLHAIAAEITQLWFVECDCCAAGLGDGVARGGVGSGEAEAVDSGRCGAQRFHCAFEECALASCIGNDGHETQRNIRCDDEWTFDLSRLRHFHEKHRNEFYRVLRTQ